MKNRIKKYISELLQRKVLMASMGYTVGNLILKGVVFLSIPIFTRLMSPRDFGLYSIFISYESILCLFVGFCFHSSIKAANIEFQGQIEKYTSSIYLAVAQISLFFILVIVVCHKYISIYAHFDFLLQLLILVQSAATAILLIYNNKISLSYNYKKYLLISSFYGIGSIILSFILILTIFQKEPYVGRIVGTVVPSILISIYVLIEQFRSARPHYNRDYWKFGVMYCLPIIPHGFSQVILAQYGRIMIQNMVGSTQTGLYSFAFTIAMIPQIVATSLDTAWEPWFFERFRDKDYKIIENRATQYTALFSFFTLVLCSLAPEIIHIMAPRVYMDAVYIVIPAIIGVYFTFLYYLPACIEYYTKKTIYIAVGTVLSGVINIGLSYIFIKKWGYIAVAYAGALTYIANFIFHYIIAYRISKVVPYNIKQISVHVILTLFGSILINIYLDSLLMRFLIVFFFLTLLIFVYIASHKDLK